MNNYKIDLHTHSIISHDGGLTEVQYSKLLTEHVLDYIAVTDHNETRFARILQQKLGERIIIGEEIKTTEGEIIGLFLQNTISPGLSPEETVQAIHDQKGLVYIPHPFETFRRGMQATALERIADQIDIVETFNGRGRWRNKNDQAEALVREKNYATAASSDAHCPLGIGKTFSRIEGEPTQKGLKELLQKGELQKQYAPLFAFLCPVVNRIKNKVIV